VSAVAAGCPLPASPLTKFSLSDRKFRHEIRNRSSDGGFGSTGFWSTCRTCHAHSRCKTLAGSTSLSADELRRAVAGKTVYLDVSGFELPIRYLDHGRMSGRMGTVAATLSIGDPVSDSGVWWIEANQLCQRWTSWLEGQTHCYRLTRKGNSVQWFRDDGRSGTARIED